MEEILLQAKRKDQKAIEKLYKTYYNDIHSTVLFIVKDQFITKELVNDTFLKAFDSLDQYIENISFKQWLKTIATNKCIDYFRKKQKNIEDIWIDIDENGIKNSLTDNETIESFLSMEETKHEIYNIVESLYYKYRNYIKNRYYEDWSYEKMAEYYNVDIGTIKSQLHKAHKALKIKYLEFINQQMKQV